MKGQFRKEEKARREAQAQADEGNEPFAVVSEGLKLEVRPLRKALVWVSKNAHVRIIIEVNPAGEQA